MNNSDDKPKNGRTPEDEEEARRNLVGFFQLLWDIDKRLKREEFSPPTPTPKNKPSNPPGPVPAPKAFEKKAPVQDTYIPPNISSSSAPTNLQSSKNLTETITVRLDPKALQRIRAMAQQKGVGPTTLIRIWMMEGLKENPMG